MTQPEGTIDKGSEGKVLKKAIYGLKQSSRTWNKKANSILISIGYSRLEAEHCLYIKQNRNYITIIALYVDDFYVFYNDKQERNYLFRELEKNLKLKDLGEIRQCLGVKIRRDWNKGIIYMDQKQYIKSVLEKFGMSDCKPIATPMETKFEIINKDDQFASIDDVPYQNVIGCLMYLAVNTRPEIAHVTGILSQYNNNHNLQHWKCVEADSPLP